MFLFFEKIKSKNSKHDVHRIVSINETASDGTKSGTKVYTNFDTRLIRKATRKTRRRILVVAEKRVEPKNAVEDWLIFRA